jgi:hypothetical protein
MLSAFGGMILSFLPYLTKAILKIKLSPFTNLFIQIFGLMGIGFGETLDCYYRFPYWDDAMHFLSGVWVSYLAYAFLYAWMGEDHLSHRRAYLAFGAFTASLAVAVLWEVYEFSFDSFFGTDMQKTIPEGSLFNGGNSFADLSGSESDIASFFRSSKWLSLRSYGYHERPSRMFRRKFAFPNSALPSYKEEARFRKGADHSLTSAPEGRKSKRAQQAPLKSL